MLIRTALTLLLLFPATAFSRELDTALSAVVRISGTRSDTPVRGSGFVIGLDRGKATIVTAAHVIEGVEQIEVTFAVDRTESFPAGAVFGMDAGSRNGLAVFQVRGALPPGVTTLSFDAKVQLQRGEELFLLGFPKLATAPLTLRRIFAGPSGNVLQLDGSVGEGFSGAPVLRKGQVVGVVTDQDPQLTYAVKATVAQDAVLGWEVKLGGQSSTQLSSTTTETRPAPPIVEKCAREMRTVYGIVFVRICAGTFTMGSAEDDPDGEADEKPAHQVTLSEFWIGMTEITNKQYLHFKPGHEYRNKDGTEDEYRGKAELPATDVSWDEAVAACEHFGGHLPTEAQWEYAARAGSQTTWSTGSDDSLLSRYAWYETNSVGAPHAVGKKKPNVWGLYDMQGNVREWVADWFALYEEGPQTDPAGPKTGQLRVVRGGAFSYPSSRLRSASRFGFDPSYQYRNIGFRCVRSPGRQP